jgi:hypothetical protein
MKCKNIECHNETKNKNVYCSLTCRNVYVNKYLRDYSKVKSWSLANSNTKRAKYNSNPNFCKECKVALTYEQRKNKFCSTSCGAQNNNKTLNRKLNKFSEQSLINICAANKKRYKLQELEYTKNTKCCLFCEKEISFLKRKYIFCDKQCRTKHFDKAKTKKQLYYKYAQFKFNLSDYPNEFNFELIKEYGWYKAKNRGNNPNGINRDHLYTISDGFKNNIEPSLLAHPANCKLITHEENIKKKEPQLQYKSYNKIEWNKTYNTKL